MQDFSKLIIAAAIAGTLTSAMQAVMADDYIEHRRTTIESSGPANAPSSTTTTTTTTESVTLEPSMVPVVPGVVVPGTAAVVTTTGGNVTAVPLSINDTTFILQTVDQRRADLAKRLLDLKTGGRLTDAQLTLLQRDLDRVNSEYIVIQGRPSLSRTLSLAKDLDVLYFQLHGFAPTVTYVPIIEGSHFTIFNGRIILLDDLAVRRIGLENKILDRLYAGKISYAQSNELRVRLNDIATAEDLCRTDGVLTPKESRDIYTAFDKVASRLDTYTGEHS